MKIAQKTALWLMRKSFSLKDYTSFERAFQEWRLRNKGDKLVGWISACANVWGTYFAKTRFRLYQNTSKGKIELIDHDFMKLMRKPNNYQTGWEQKYLTAIYWILYGKMYFLKLRNLLEQPAGLVIMKPWRVEAVGSKSSYIDHYTYDTGEDIVKIKKEDVIHLKLPNPDSFTDGRAVISGFIDTQAVDELQMSYQKKFLEEGGFAGRTFVAKNEMGEATFNRIFEQLKTQYGGQENAFKVALLELVEPVKAAYSIKDLDIVRQRMLTRDEILGGMQVPKILLGIGESINRQTAETAVWQFASGIIDPYMDYIEQVLTIHIQQDWKDGSVELIHDVMAPKDIEAETKRLLELFKNGAITLNEIRDENNYPLFDFPLADASLIQIGGGLINANEETLIGAKTDQNVQLPAEPKALAKSEDMDLIWKQFDSRHVRNAEKMSRGLKGFLNLQQDRVLKKLGEKSLSDDIEGFYLSDEELALIQQFLEQEYLRLTQQGFQWGTNLYNVPMSFYDKDNLFVRHLIDAVNAHALSIQKTTLDDIRNFVGDEINNLSNAEMSRIIKMKYKEIAENRVPKIVNTTVSAGLNAGLLHAMQAAGRTTKVWLSERDSRVRYRPNANHKDADGQEKPLNDPFLVSGEECLHPADASLSAGNAVNCRCTIFSPR